MKLAIFSDLHVAENSQHANEDSFAPDDIEMSLDSSSIARAAGYTTNETANGNYLSIDARGMYV